MLLFVALPWTSSAQVARPVADINPGPVTAGTDNYYFEARFARLGERAVFPSDDGIHGAELWVTDGTAAGTELVTDICPGICSSLPRQLISAGDRAFFVAEDGSHGIELWVTDGTRGGTRMVADIAPGLASSRPWDLAVQGRRVAFSADAGDGTGREPWISDGTAAGTRSLGDLRPGPEGSGPIFWSEVGGRWLFVARDDLHGSELWQTDGTAQGTSLVIDWLPGPDSGMLAIDSSYVFPAFVRLADRLFFFARKASGDWALTVSDGTALGTSALHPGGRPFLPYGLGLFDGRVYFSNENGSAGELWATDGTPEGTVLVASFPGDYARRPVDLFADDDRLYFIGWDEQHGSEVWSTDGTAQGTGLVADVRLGPDSALFFAFAGFLPAGGRTFFLADDGVRGVEPWLTDGTAAGTVLAADLFPGAIGSFHYVLPSFIDRRTSLGDRALFRAWVPESGTELHVLDGVTGAIERLEINRQASAWQLTPFPHPEIRVPRLLAALDDRVVLQAEDGQTGLEPWVSDGTAAGTTLLGDLYEGPYTSFPYGFLGAEHGAIFAARTTSGPGELWTTDGTATGTEPLSATAGAPPASQLISTARLGGLAFFAADRSGDGLYATDGTRVGTRLLPASTPYAYPLVSHDGWVYFGDEEPRRTDGWTVETIGEVRPGPEGSQPYPLGPAGGRMLFAADDGVSGHELWAATDPGTGAELLREIRPGTAGGLADRPGYDVVGEIGAASSEGRLYFLADDGVSGQELWTSDGTADGTRLLRDIRPGSRSSEIRWLTASRGRAFFTANDGTHGRELWVSDATPGGTRMLADLVPGSGASLPQGLRAAGDSVFLSAHSPAHGRELYVVAADGSSPQRVTDIAPGPLPSSPLVLTPAGDWLYFMANDGTSGFELWRLPLTDAIFSDGFESGDTTAWSMTNR